MINLFNPEVPPLQHAGLLEAIALLSDPAATQKLLADLKAAKTTADAAITEAKSLQLNITEREQALQTGISQHETNKAAHVELLKESGNKLDQREAEILRDQTTKANSLAVRESALQTDRENHAAAVRAFHDRLAKFGADIRALLPA